MLAKVYNMENKQELVVLEKQLKVLNKNLQSRNNLFVMEHEALYLMKGYATELIDKVYLLSTNRKTAFAKIFGVEAKDQSNGRYLWIYLFYNDSLYKCYNLRSAYEITEELKEINELERKINKLSKKIAAKEKLLQISSN